MKWYSVKSVQKQHPLCALKFEQNISHGEQGVHALVFVWGSRVGGQISHKKLRSTDR